MSGGRFSRQKGKRNEYALRDYLRRMGYQADRVPSSGAAQGFKGDIRGVKDGKTTLFELKARRDSYGTFYALIDAIRATGTDRIGVTVPGLKKQCVDISGSLGGIYDVDPHGIYEFAQNSPFYEKHKRAFQRLAVMEELLGDSDILVVKDDRKPYIFFRFRG